QRRLFHHHRTDRTMAETDRVTRAAPLPQWAHPVTLVRVAIILAVLVIWEAVAASGLLYRDVVPRLGIIVAAVWKLLSTPDYYWHLGVTAGEVGTRPLGGRGSGLLVGLVLRAHPLPAPAVAAHPS